MQAIWGGVVLLAVACTGPGGQAIPTPGAAPLPVAELGPHERFLATRAFAFILRDADSLAPRCLELRSGTSALAPDSALLATIGAGQRVQAGRDCPKTYWVMGGYVDPITGESDVKRAPPGYHDPVIVRLWLPLSDTLVRVRRTQGTLGYQFDCKNTEGGLSCPQMTTIHH